MRERVPHRMQIKLKALKDWAKRMPADPIPITRTLILAEHEKVDTYEFIGKIGTWLKISEMEVAQDFALRPDPRYLPAKIRRHYNSSETIYDA